MTRAKISKRQLRRDRRFDAKALAAQVLEVEQRAKHSFVKSLWAIADMLAEGLAKSGWSVTRYTSIVAGALGRSESYVDKYLRLARVPPERRIEAAEQHSTFRATWAHFFPPPAKPEPGPRPKPEPEPEPEPASTAPVDEDLDEEQGDEQERPEPPASESPSAAEHVETGSAQVLAALGAPTVADALTRITQLHQGQAGAQAEIERLRRKIAKLEKERDTLLLGGPIGELLRELDVANMKEALAAVRSMKGRIDAA